MRVGCLPFWKHPELERTLRKNVVQNPRRWDGLPSSSRLWPTQTTRASPRAPHPCLPRRRLFPCTDVSTAATPILCLRCPDPYNRPIPSSVHPFSKNPTPAMVVLCFNHQRRNAILPTQILCDSLVRNMFGGTAVDGMGGIAFLVSIVSGVPDPFASFLPVIVIKSCEERKSSPHRQTPYPQIQLR